MATVDPLENCTGFDWDEANTVKIWERHRLTPAEAEDIFFISRSWYAAMFAIRKRRSDTTSSGRRVPVGGCL